MQVPETTVDEDGRLEALRSLNVLDTEPEERFDRLTRTARRLFDVPVALVSLVDANRQWFKSCMGLGVRETPRDISFCGHAILGDDVFVISDALQDPGLPTIRWSLASRIFVFTLAVRCGWQGATRWARCASSTPAHGISERRTWQR